MASSQTCPVCGKPVSASAPGGLCSKCLLMGLVELGPPPATEETTQSSPGPQSSDIIGDYELIEPLGRGGMGLVWRARQRSLNRLVALKMIRTGEFADVDEIRRFRNEAEAVAHLDHPNIVPIFEIGEEAGRHFFSMKLMEGGSLAGRMDDGTGEHRGTSKYTVRTQRSADASSVGSPLPSTRGRGVRAPLAAELVAKVARAVHFAHQRGLLHRDLKPANILLDANDEPLVADFGLARRLGTESSLTGTGNVLGSPAYMAPEQATSRPEALTTSADIYSLGAIFFHLLTGRPPFHGATPLETLRQAAENEPPSLRSLNPALDRDLETICLKCLAKDPAKRYTSAWALADDLDRWQRGEPIQARPATARERAVKWTRCHPAAAAFSALALLTPVLIIAILLVMGGRVTGERNRAQQQAEWTRLNLYAADMQVAQAAVEDANITLARKILERYRPGPGEPDMRGFEWRYLWQRSRSGQARILRGHSQPVVCAAFSPDGNWLASTEDSALVNFWNTTGWQAGRPIDQSGPDGGRFRWISYSRESTLMAISFVDGYAAIVDLPTHAWSWTLRPRPATSSSVSRTLWSPRSDIIAFCADTERGDPFVAVLDWIALQNKRQVACPTGCYALVEHSSGSKVYRYPEAPIIRLAADQVYSFTPEGHLLVGRAGSLLEWDPDCGQELVVIPSGHRFDYCERTRGGKWVAGFNSERKDRHYVLLDESRSIGTACWEMAGHEGDLRALALAPDNRRVVTGSADHTARIWDMASRQTLATLRGHGDEVTAVAWSPDGKVIATGSKDRTLMIWAAEEVHDQDSALEPLSSAFAPWLLAREGTALACATSSDGSGLAVWDLAQRRPQALFTNIGYTPVFLSTADERLLTVNWSASGGGKSAGDSTQRPEDYRAELRSWDLGQTNDASNVLRVLAPTRPPLTRPAAALWAMSADQRWLAGAIRPSQLNLWWLGSQSESARELPVASRPVTRLTFAPKEASLAVLQSDHGGGASVALWSLGADAPASLGALECSASVNELAWAPDGRSLALACDDHTLQLWDVQTRRLLQTLEGHKLGVVAAAFSPDGRTLASGDGRTIKLWHVATGRETLTLYRDIKIGDPLRWLSFSADGTLLLAADQGGRVQFFRGPPQSQLDAPDEQMVNR